MVQYLHVTKANDNFKQILGAKFDPSLDYQLIFPSSVPTKRRDGWWLVLEDADEILGQTLVLVGRSKNAES